MSVINELRQTQKLMSILPRNWWISTFRGHLLKLGSSTDFVRDYFVSNCQNRQQEDVHQIVLLPTGTCVSNLSIVKCKRTILLTFSPTSYTDSEKKVWFCIRFVKSVLSECRRNFTNRPACKPILHYCYRVIAENQLHDNNCSLNLASEYIHIHLKIVFYCFCTMSHLQWSCNYDVCNR